MTTVNTIPTPKAAPLGNMPATTPGISRQQAIENALCMALYYIRDSERPGNIHAATVKAVRAAAMLKQACTDVTLNDQIQAFDVRQIAETQPAQAAVLAMFHKAGRA